MRTILAGILFLMPIVILGQDAKILMHWGFEDVENRNLIEASSGIADTIEGNFDPAPGVLGQGLRFDGFTTCVKRSSIDKASTGDEFTVEAWVALGNYPWNWCPVLTTESNETMGYRLMIGPLGQASFEAAINEQWISCSSETEALPLRKWIHITGVFKADESMTLYINGELKAENKINGSISDPMYDCTIGMVAAASKPSDIHRTWGTIAAYYGIDGILDEISVFDMALTPDEVLKSYSEKNVPKADIAPRKLPDIEEHPGSFGAFYTKLKYYPGWDDLWPVEQDPDIVVCFDKSPIKLIFWRGIRYAASWVSENNNWMSDQSVEAWEHGEKDREGCFEHMQDRHCRFSHVRIIENTDARIVVHWRYAPVSAYNNTWHPDPKTGWECWIDEYYYIYPDATAIRKVSWKKGSLGYPRQFQETLALIHPGQKISDLLETDFALVGDYEGNTGKQSFVEDPNVPPFGPFNWDQNHDYTIQQYGFKSQHKPFICFEPGNKIFLRNGKLGSYDMAGGCNHFPVGQARCDGRTTRMSDRPSHATSFPISDPVIHEKGDRYFWNGLYGMNDMDLTELTAFGRSWAYAPEVSVNGSGFHSAGYDGSERCYQIENSEGKAGELKMTLAGSSDTPVHNPAFYIRNWNADGASVLVDGKELQDCKTGIHHKLEGKDLIVFLRMKSNSNVIVSIKPE
ncbi:MAG TPA: LamG domain-containing protein [Bacteroides sp.]|nr:LamG domain-containing protein [Bacteroides sp.]